MNSDLVLRDGDAIDASGLVIVDTTGVVVPWFEPLLPQPAVARVGPPERPVPGVFAVPVSGVDLDRLDAAPPFPDVVVGVVTLRGVWRSGTVHVEEVVEAVPGSRHPDTVPHRTNGPDSAAPAFAEPESLRAWEAHLSGRVDDWLLLQWGGQDVVHPTGRLALTAARVTHELATWCDDLPPGCVEVDAWLWPGRIAAARWCGRRTETDARAESGAARRHRVAGRLGVRTVGARVGRLCAHRSRVPRPAARRGAPGRHRAARVVRRPAVPVVIGVRGRRAPGSGCVGAIG